MKSFQVLILLAMLIITLVIADSETALHKGSQIFTSSKNNNSTKISYKYGGGHMSCDKNPRVCRIKGSEGHDCCRKKCVNVSTDRNNCGECGKKCKYLETCCKEG
ncbi:hypothetical protein Lal_00038666 [Lupinus albus]|nr:hypothetical protein Lal_00038666 [Lupinus albus]